MKGGGPLLFPRGADPLAAFRLHAPRLLQRGREPRQPGPPGQRRAREVQLKFKCRSWEKTRAYSPDFSIGGITCQSGPSVHEHGKVRPRLRTCGVVAQGGHFFVPRTGASARFNGDLCIVVFLEEYNPPVSVPQQGTTEFAEHPAVGKAIYRPNMVCTSDRTAN